MPMQLLPPPSALPLPPRQPLLLLASAVLTVVVLWLAPLSRLPLSLNLLPLPKRVWHNADSIYQLYIFNRTHRSTQSPNFFLL
jgi:hypothetical protein